MTAQDGGLEQQEGGLDRSHDELLALRINITAALKKLAVDEQNRQVIAGGIPLLLQQLSQGGSEPAAQALQVRIIIIIINPCKPYHFGIIMSSARWC
jgi:hypothetical protein